MTSTRNNNTPGNYLLEQRNYELSQAYESYKHSQYGKAYHTALPALGFNPSHMPRGTFVENPIDVESALFGINSTNLVKPQEPVVPLVKTVPTVCFFNTQALIMPNPLVIENKQRPFPVPN